MTEVEEWRPIPEYEGIYEASSTGRIRSLDRTIWVADRSTGELYARFKLGQVLRPGLRKDGYLQVGLSVDGKARHRGVHQLVCAAFHGPAPTPVHHAAHGDGDSLNNCQGNLRWATPAENGADRVAHGIKMPWRRSGARGAQCHTAVISEGDVVEMRRLLKSHKIIEVAKIFGVSRHVVSNVHNRRAWNHVPG